MIDRNSRLPLYHQLEEAIKQQIQTGSLKPDDPIPSEREFSEEYGISRMTVRQALTNLVNEGLLYRRKGSGTFVNKQKVEQILQGLTSFSEDMKERGFEPGNRILSYEMTAADRLVAGKLHVDQGTEVLRIARIRLADGLPMALETAYMPLSIARDLKKEQAKDSLYDYIEKTLSLKIDEAYQELEASAATEQVAEHLQIEEGSPILKINRVTYLEDGQPCEYVQSAFRADRYRFYNVLKREQR